MKMDDVTQQNTALVEEAAAAAESLMDQADELLKSVSVFQLTDGDTPKDRNQSQSTKSLQPAKKITSKPAVSAKAKKATTSTDDEWEEF
jgi:methyl-accepting chemotaxis protein